MILYKYYGYAAGLAALSSSQLGFRCPKYFNDPFELTFPTQKTNRAGEQLVSTLDQLRQSVAILSLTRAPLNALMWSHYAEDHKGFVIGYEVSGEFLTSARYNLVPVQEGEVAYASPSATDVLRGYDKKTVLSVMHLNIGAPLTDNLARIKALSKVIFLTKHPRWASESEVRVIKLPSSYFEETHVYQSDPLRTIVDTSSRRVAPYNSCSLIEGLHIYQHQVPIVEVYMGVRNPLVCNVREREEGTSVSRHLIEKAGAEGWKIYRAEIDNASWDLRAVEVENEALAIVSHVRGLTHYSKVPGTIARMIRDKLANENIRDDDVFEMTTWSGECHLQKNGEFI